MNQEYREVKPYWTKRIRKEFSFIPDVLDAPKVGDCIYCDIANVQCTLRLGYTKKHMTAKITRIETVDGKDTDLAIDGPVYAIRLADVREATE